MRKGWSEIKGERRKVPSTTLSPGIFPDYRTVPATKILGQVRFIVNMDHHMEMVHHGNVGMDDYAVFNQYLMQALAEHFLISFLFHEQSAAIGAGSDVIG
jgi:hypothetical protein